MFSIRQIYFEPRQLKLLDPAFIPFDNSGNSNPDHREFAVFREQYLTGQISPEGYHGYVSWKFKRKTHIDGATFIRFCESHPGYDVYFVNPFPLFIAQGNVWDCGEANHPGIKDLVRSIFQAVGYKIDLDQMPASLKVTSYCNFWVGNRRFWDAYMKFCLPVFDYIEKKMPEIERGRLYAKADERSGASFFSYIFERLFTTFLASQTDIKYLGYELSEEELARQYSRNEIQLVNEVRRVEAKLGRVADPFKADPQLRSSVAAYWQAREGGSSVKKALKRGLRTVWHWVPFRARLLDVPLVNRLTESVHRSVSHDPAISKRSD